MKLQIKTLARKQLVIEIDETKTVHDLKCELAHYPDVGVQPELQKLIYSGKVLLNEDQLSAYEIDVKKFLVVMTLRYPEVPPSPSPTKSAKASDDEITSKPTATPTRTTTLETITPKKVTGKDTKKTAVKSPSEEALAQITAMGYSEPDAQSALEASFNNVERAIEYLVEGKPSTVAAREQQQQQHAANGNDGDDDEWTDIDDEDDNDVPMEVLRCDPLFRALRSNLMRNPAAVDALVQQICGQDRELLQLVNDNREDFMHALIDDVDDELDNDDDEVA